METVVCEIEKQTEMSCMSRVSYSVSHFPLLQNADAKKHLPHMAIVRIK